MELLISSMKMIVKEVDLKRLKQTQTDVLIVFGAIPPEDVDEENTAVDARIHLDWTRTPEDMWRMFWRDFLHEHYADLSFEAWSIFWYDAYPSSSPVDPAMYTFCRESWKIVYARRHDLMTRDAEKITRVVVGDTFELGIWLNMIQHDADDSFLKKTLQLLGDIFRERGSSTMACLFYNQFTPDMKLFTTTATSDDFVLGHAISHYYIRHGSRSDAIKHLDRIVLRTLPTVTPHFFNQITQLQHWYHPRLVECAAALNARRTDWDHLRDTVRRMFPSNHTSSCSLSGTKGLLRSVNYEIVRDSGAYRFDGNVTTQNYWITIDPYTGDVDPASLIHIAIPDRFKKRDAYIKGMEDMRVFVHPSFPDKLYALGTSFEYGCTDGRPSQVFCVFDANSYETLRMSPLEFENHQCQKNWVPAVGTDGAVNIIYGWSPYRVLRVPFGDDGYPLQQDDPIIPEVLIETFQHPFRIDTFRGSTNPVFFPELNEWHIIIHEVYYMTGCASRKYRHRVVTLSADLCNVLSTTIPFVFEDNQIEYTIGFTVTDEIVLLHYSVWDNHSRMLSIPKPRWLEWVRQQKMI